MKNAPTMTLDAVRAFIQKEFPQTGVEVESVGYRRATARQQASDNLLRPGGTISGPAMIELADVAVYIAILATLGPVALAVTTSLTANFLRKPAAHADLIAKVRLMKVGRRLVVGDVHVYSEGDDEPVAHVVATYSVPPESA